MNDHMRMISKKWDVCRVLVSKQRDVYRVLGSKQQDVYRVFGSALYTYPIACQLSRYEMLQCSSKHLRAVQSDPNHTRKERHRDVTVYIVQKQNPGAHFREISEVSAAIVARSHATGKRNICSNCCQKP